MKKKITLKNIFWYLQGNSRYLLIKYLPIIVSKYIRTQIAWRNNSVATVCELLGACEHCGCSIPELQYCDPECFGLCYPALMDKPSTTALKCGLSVWDDTNKVYWKVVNNRYTYYNDK